MSSKKLKTLIIGLGQIGYANAEYISKLGLEVDGYDINKIATKKAIEAGVIKNEAKNFEDYDVYIICVSTHNPSNMFTPCFNGLMDTVQRLRDEGKENALVTVESTISKDVCKEILSTLNHRIHIAHVPHRFYGKEKEDHGVRQLRVLGGYRPCCVEAAIGFYRNRINIPIKIVHTVELAAISKVIENAYRFLEIAFAEELKLFCDANGLNFEELRGAVNSKWNIHILEAQKGIGGHCLPKDTQMYLQMHKGLFSSILEAAVETNKEFESQLLGKRPFCLIPVEEKLIDSS